MFGADVKPRKTRGRFPVKDHAKLGAVLAALGRSNLVRDFEALDHAVRDGVVHPEPGAQAAFTRACDDISAMRRDLLMALGIQPGGEL